MPNATPVAVVRNDAPLVLLSVGPDSCLDEVRAQLRRQGLILDSDVFVDQKGFPVPLDKEAEWALSDLLARSDEKTLRLKSTEREAKKSLFSRLSDAAAKAQPPETPTAPELAKDKGLTPREGDVKAREIATPVGGVTLGSDALADPVLLDKEAWKNIIERNNLLRGIRLDEDPPAPSFKPAFGVVGGIPRFVVQDSAFISATVTHSESVHAMVVNKFSKVEASASYCFVSTSFERSQRDSRAETSAEARTWVVGQWNLPRVVVQLRPEDLAPDPALTAAVAAIVERPDSAELKYFALRRLFREYGQVWATEVTLGGQLTITDTVTITDRKEEKATEAAMRLAVAAKIGAFKAGVGGATSTETVEKSSQFKQFQDKQFQATGGDTRLTQEPGSWVSTIGAAANWRVIGRRGLMPLYMVLCPDQRQKVREILAGVDARFMPELLESGAPQDVPWRDALRAETDGFLVAHFVGCPAGRGEVWGAASGANGIPGEPAAVTTLWGPPSTAPRPGTPPNVAAAEMIRRAMMAMIAATQGQPVPGTERVETQTLTLPVRRRDMMMIEPLGLTEGAPAAAAAGRWYAMSYLDEAYFNPMEAPATTAGQREGLSTLSWAPQADGFTLLTARVPAGSAAEVTIDEEGPAALHARLSLDAKAAGITHAAVCLPVRRSCSYRFATPNGPDGRPLATLGLRFVAINPHLGGLDEPSAVKPSVCYLAESDGFLFGAIAARGKTMVHVVVSTGRDRDQFQKQEPAAAMTLLRNGSGCLGVPIRKNNYYYVHATGLPDATTIDALRFYPLRRY